MRNPTGHLSGSRADAEPCRRAHGPALQDRLVARGSLRFLPALGLVLDHFPEGVFELRGHPLLEEREQRLGGERPEGVDGVDELLPALVRLTRAFEGLPQLPEVEPCEGSRDRFAVAVDAFDEGECGAQRDPEGEDLLSGARAAPGWGLRSGRRRAGRAASACAPARCLLRRSRRSARSVPCR